MRVRASQLLLQCRLLLRDCTGVLGGPRFGWGVHGRESLRADQSTGVAGVCGCAEPDALAATTRWPRLSLIFRGKARTRAV